MSSHIAFHDYSAEWRYQGDEDVATHPIDLKHPDTQAALAYWRSKCAAGRIPAPRAINPSEIPRLLASIVIIDVLGPPPDYFFRIEGEIVQNIIGFRRMGHRLSELKDHYGSVYEQSRTTFAKVCAARAPIVHRGPLALGGRRLYEVEVLMLPLSSDGLAIDRLAAFMGLAFHR